MLPDVVVRSLRTVSQAISASPTLGEALEQAWTVDGQAASDEVCSAVFSLGDVLPGLTCLSETNEALCALVAQPEGEALLRWCASSARRRDVVLAPLLRRASTFTERSLLVEKVASDRVVLGPLLDALGSAPAVGDGHTLEAPEHRQTRARIEILLWEAGAQAIELPELGPWIWGSSATFDALIRHPAHAALRGRVLAARCLEVSVRSMPASADAELVSATLHALQPLLLHPEPLVWVHAARALGRLTERIEPMEGTILDWVVGSSQTLRQRALTALAALPRSRFGFFAHQLVTILSSPDENAWALAALASSTPYLFVERRDLWDRLESRIVRTDRGAVAVRALARGCSALWRRGVRDPDVERCLRTMRELARSSKSETLDEARRWGEVISLTDVVDGAERDPLDLELGLENLVRLAAQYDDEEADARAARFAGALATAFSEASRLAFEPGRLRQRGSALYAVEGLARAFALRLWDPMLETHGNSGPANEQPDLNATWNAIASAPAAILDLVRERRKTGEGTSLSEVPLEVLALRLGGYAIDACGQDAELGPGPGPLVHDTCQWLRKVEGLADGTRTLPAELESALSPLFWRLVDTTRGSALGEVDDIAWLGPFAAWWALVIDRPAMLARLATALPMLSTAALSHCCERAESLRSIVSAGSPDGGWTAEAKESLEALWAVDTELGHALLNLGAALEAFASASGRSPELEASCLQLVLAGDRLRLALANPVKALHAHSDLASTDSLDRNATENAPRVAALVARSVRSRNASMLDVWLASVGPVGSMLLEQAVARAIARTPAPPPVPPKPERRLIAGYELVKNLGEGGIGTVWLVRKPGADRLFVLKIPKAEALANATDTERAGILASFEEEAKALAGLYHPNVASIIDRGVSGDVPFLVLEYLIGADLKQYSAARPMTLFELRNVVPEACAGLASLHAAGLVHRDIKPANVWLRLPLRGGERFDPEKHRDPAQAAPLATVVIDFGMVRAIRVPAAVGGRFVAGTSGYIAPEQVLDPVELDPRADVYALAATIYNVTTGRAFFDEIENPRDRILAHMKRDPFDDAERLRPFPAGIARVLRAATLHDPRDRPHPLELGRAFVAEL
jgi:hypothetical protein